MLVYEKSGAHVLTRLLITAYHVNYSFHNASIRILWKQAN